jgi:hypothetical protein
MYSILARQINILNSMNDKIRSRELYLPTVAVVIGDADGGDDRTRSMSKSSSKSSMRGGGRVRRSWRRIRRDVASSDLDGRQPVVKVGSSRTDSASQKPYSSSPGAGSQRWGFRRPALIRSLVHASDRTGVATRKARSRISADHSRRCRAPAPFARQGEARRASARVWAFLSPPHTRLEKVERTSIFKYGYLHFNKQCDIKEFPHPSFSHEWAFEIY